VLGQDVMTLVDDDQAAGYKVVTMDGTKLSSGIYFYRIQAGNYTESRKLLLLK
jgi:hypothetical protein